MKKTFALIICLLAASSAFAFQPAEWMNQSSTFTADAEVTSGPGYIYGIVFVTDGTNSVTCAVYDSTSASGTKLVPNLVLAATPQVQTLSFDPSVPFKNGIYVDITTAGSASFMVYYREK